MKHFYDKKIYILLVMLCCIQHSYSQTKAEKLGKATIDYIDAIAWAKALKESKCGKFEKKEDKFWSNPNLAIEYATKNSEKYTTENERARMKKLLEELVVFSKKQNLEFYNSLHSSDCEKVVKQFQGEYEKRMNIYNNLLK